MTKLIKYGVGGMFFLLPLFFVPPPYAVDLLAQMSISKMVLGFCLGNILYAIILARAVHPAFGLIHLGFSSLAASTAPAIWSGPKLFLEFGLMQLYPYIYWTTTSFVVFFISSSSDLSRAFYFRCLIWAGVFSSALAFLQAMDMDPIMTYAANITPEDRIRPIGMLGQATKFGALMAALVGLALGLKRYPEAAIMTAAALLTKSSFTYLSLLAAYGIWVKHLIPKHLYVKGLVAGALSALAYFLHKPNAEPFLDNGRFLVWATSIQATLEKAPWLGFGPGSFAAIYEYKFQPKALMYGGFVEAHNDYVQVFFEGGFFGLFILLIVMFITAERYYRLWWHGRQQGCLDVAAYSALAALMVNAIGNFTFQLAPHYILAAICLTIVLEGHHYRGKMEVPELGKEAWWPRILFSRLRKLLLRSP